MGGPQLFVQILDTYALALVYGSEATHATRAVACTERKYSKAGKGWLVPIDLVADLEAFAAYYRILSVTYRAKGRDLSRGMSRGTVPGGHKGDSPHD